MSNRTPQRFGFEDMGLEAIQYQGKSRLFEELTMAVDRLKDMAKKRALKKATIDEAGVSRIIAKYTGLNIDVVLTHAADMTYNASMDIVVINENSPLLNVYKVVKIDKSEFKDHTRLEKDLRVLTKDLRGSINRSTSRVTGIFTKVKNRLTISYDMIVGLESPQLAAVLLHEIGHLFVSFESIVCTAAVNALIAIAAEDLAGAETEEERLELVYAINSQLGPIIDDPAALAKQAKSKEEYGLVILREWSANPTRQDNVYAFRNNEYLADHFAAMHGAGRDLALALDTVYRRFEVQVRPTKAMRVATTVDEILVLAIGLIPPVGWMFLYFMFTNPFMNIKLYDDPKERVERVRLNLIQTLKSKDLDHDSRRELLLDLDVIEKLMVDMRDHRSLFDLIWTSLTSERRRQYNQLRFQQELEKIANNDIFVSSSKLKTIAGA